MFNISQRWTIWQKKLQISKRENVKGEDGYKVFSVRLKDSTVERLDKIAAAANRSRNELVNIMLDYAVENCEITELCGGRSEGRG